MRIFVASQSKSAEKVKGDLLEELAGKLLAAQDFAIEDKNVRKAGMELDLVCRHKVNNSKKIYVECKAYQENKNIDSQIIKSLFATRSIENYDEAWLVTSSHLGSDAKGLVEKIGQGDDKNKFAFYTADKIIDALQGSRVVVSHHQVRNTVGNFVSSLNHLGDMHLLVSTYGIFWIVEYKKSGTLDGFICVYASNGEIVLDYELIENINNLDFMYSSYDFGTILKLLDPNDKTIEGRRLRGAKLKEEYSKKMALSSGVITTKSGINNASIDDLFVYPDIEVIDTDKTKTVSNEVSSQKILNSRDNAWLLFGEDLSGKTILSYMLQRKLVEMSNVAIRINSSDLKSLKPSALDKVVIKAFISQYDVYGIPHKTVESYLQDIRKDITLIVDDFDKIKVRRTSDRTSLALYMYNAYAKVIMFANSSKELELMTSNENSPVFEKYKAYRILQLGHIKRDELIEKWITFHSSERINKAELLIKKDDYAARINTAIGTNYLPTHSFYILTILEILESGNKAKLQGSEYAALYGHLVNHALLVNNIKPFELGFYNAYLAYLARELHRAKASSISNADLESLFSKYLSLMELDKSYEQIHQKLIASRILRIDDGYYSFNLQYYKYFFLAKYLSDDIETEESKAAILYLVDNLHEDDSSNTVVFLVHHSKNSDIIDAIVEKAKSQFDDIAQQTLVGSEIEGINALITDDIGFSLQSGTATEHRKKRLKRQDDYERRQRNTEKTDNSNILDVYGQITSAFRTIDVLGKITSNYSGELTGKRKNLIMSELYSLGFRSLHAFLESFENYTDSLRNHIETKIVDKKITSSADKRKAADQIIYGFTHIITYSFIKRVSDSIASPDLMRTLENVLSDEKTPAAKLTSVATKLNFPGSLEKNKTSIVKLYEEFSSNSLARDLLRFLVLEYLYKFEVEYNETQSICGHLNINFAKVSQKKLKGKIQNK